MAIAADKMIRFGDFELNLKTGELWKSGMPVKLQPQPARVLMLLAQRAGHLVTREEIQQQIWKNETFVDFEQGVNFCVKQIRAVLGDDAEAPRYIETLPRRGYRFVALVQEVNPGAPAPAAPTAARTLRLFVVIPIVLITAVVLAAMAGKYLRSLSLHRSTSPPQGRIMLAVLPLENLSGDPDQAYLSDGLTEEIITELGRLQPARLGVIARTSAWQYRNTSKTVDVIGRELGVSYILEGSVRREGNRVRISTQLIRVSDQSHLWANSYERELKDVLALEAELARTVAREIRITLAPNAFAKSVRESRTNGHAYEAYLRGRYHWRKLTPDDFERAIGFFQQCLDSDPGYAPAYAGIADSYYGLSNMRLPPKEAMAKARAAAEKALELDPNLPEAHLSLAYVKTFYDWDWPGGEKEFRSAIDLDPSFAEARVWYGAFLAMMGRVDESTNELTLAQVLDPVSLNAINTLALPMYLAGRYDEAIAQSRKALELEPNFPMAHAGLGVLYLAKNDPSTAIREFTEARKLNDSPELLAYVANAHAVAGETRQARRILAQLEAVSRRNYVSPFNLALVHAGLGDLNEAIKWLERGYAERAEGMINLKTDPRLNNLRADPRFQNLLSRMNFPQ